MKKSTGPKCLECGKRLQRILSMQSADDYPAKTLESLPRIPGYGIHGNGIFCSHTCGFAWAVRWAKRIYFWR